jgi:hypothetical protein
MLYRASQPQSETGVQPDMHLLTPLVVPFSRVLASVVLFLFWFACLVVLSLLVLGSTVSTSAAWQLGAEVYGWVLQLSDLTPNSGNFWCVCGVSQTQCDDDSRYLFML